MPDADRPLLDELREELAGMSAQWARLANLRWRLAELELRESTQTAKRLAVWSVAAAVILLTALPVLTLAAADWLDTALPLHAVRWAWVLGLGMALAGPVLGWTAWRRFRRGFHGMEQSIEELREDLVWLREWTGSAGKHDSAASRSQAEG